MEWREQAGFDAREEIAVEDEVVVAQGQDVGLVGTIGRGGEAEQELRREMSEQAALGRGCGVVEFVDDDVIEMLRREALEVRVAAECLHRGA